MSAADLRERPKTTDAHLQQVMFARLGRQRAPKKWLERHSGSQRRAQVNFVVAEETGAQSTVSCQSYAIAGSAVGVRHRSYHPDAAFCSGQCVVTRGPIATRRTGCRLQGPERFN